MRSRIAIAVTALAMAVTLHAARSAELRVVATPENISRSFTPGTHLHVVNVWATWCVPCVAEMKDLRALHSEFAPDGVDFLGVSMDDAIPGDRQETIRHVERFLARHDVPYRNVYYTGPIPKLQDYFRFEGEIPLTVVFDAQGRELARVQGQIHKDELRRKLRSLLVRK